MSVGHLHTPQDVAHQEVPLKWINISKAELCCFCFCHAGSSTRVRSCSGYEFVTYSNETEAG